MSGTISNTGVQPINYDQLLRGLEDVKQLPGIGQGLAALLSANIPSALQDEGGDTAVASLAFFQTSGAGVDTTVLLVQIAVSMRDTEVGNQNAKINADMETKKNQAKEKEEKLADAQKKMDEAAEKKKEGSLIDKIKLAFEWVGAILAVATAAVLIATGVATAVGVLMMAAAVTAVIMAIDSTIAVTNEGGRGIAGSIAYDHVKRHGGTDEEAQKVASKADMGFRISMAVLGLAFSIAAGGASLTSSAKAIANAVSEGAKIARTAMSVAEAGTSVAAAGVDAGRTVVTYQAEKLGSEVKALQGESKKSEAIMQQLDAMIDDALSRLMAQGDRFSAILDGLMEAVQDRGRTLSQAKFKG